MKSSAEADSEYFGGDPIILKTQIRFVSSFQGVKLLNVFRNYSWLYNLYTEVMLGEIPKWL